MSSPYDYSGVPEHLREGLDRWLCQGILPGGFLRAVIANDLTDAVLRADPVSYHALKSIIFFLVNEAPREAWGSPDCWHQWPLYLSRLEAEAEAATEQARYHGETSS